MFYFLLLIFHFSITTMIIWFKRNDGQLFATEESSASFQLMMRTGEFTPCDEKGNELETLTPENESQTDTQQSAVEHAGTPENSGQSGPAKRGRARSKNKAKSSDE